MSFDSDLQARSAEMREQVRRIETCSDPATRTAALALVRSVMDLHQSALERMLDVIEQTSAEPSRIIENFVQDPLIHSVLMLHDLHPHDLETRITRALAQLQPKLQRHKAEAKVISVADRMVHVFLEVAPQHSSSSATLKSSIEQVLTDAAPDAQITVEATADLNSSFVPIESLVNVVAEGAGVSEK
jgi:Fe-S cluster biogenesis protein NfuA